MLSKIVEVPYEDMSREELIFQLKAKDKLLRFTAKALRNCVKAIKFNEVVEQNRGKQVKTDTGKSKGKSRSAEVHDFKTGDSIAEKKREDKGGVLQAVEGKCPKCDKKLTEDMASSVWTLTTRPNRQGEAVQMRIGIVNCCGRKVRAVFSKNRVEVLKPNGKNECEDKQVDKQADKNSKGKSVHGVKRGRPKTFK